MSIWDDERAIPLLYQLIRDEGLSASQAAARMSTELEVRVTRNAIIGKVQRIPGLEFVGHAGVKFRTVKISRAQRKVSKAKADRTAKANGTVSVSPTWPHAPRKIIEDWKEPAATYTPPAEQMVATLDLEDHHCRWPIGDPRKPDFRHCGGARVRGEKSPYCLHHLRAAYGIPSELAQDGQTAPGTGETTPETIAAAPEPSERDLESV